MEPSDDSRKFPAPRSERRVGVVIPAYNVASWLDELLHSLRAQTLTEWFAVVVDDASTDTTAEIARSHAQHDDRIRVIPNTLGRGAPLARSCGRAELPADVDVLTFPDGDDVLHPAFLETLAGRVRSDPSLGAVYCAASRIDAAGVQFDEPPPDRVALSPRWVRRLHDHEPTPFESIYAWKSGAYEAVIAFRATNYDDAGGWAGWPVQGGEGVDLLARVALTSSIAFESTALYSYRKRAGQHSEGRGNHTTAALAIREHWRDRARREPEITTLVDRAEFFIENRLETWSGCRMAWRFLKGRHPKTAARFFLGAVRRYRWSIRRRK